MEEGTISLTIDVDTVIDCESVILVPEIAIKEPGYIKCLTVKAGAHAKHEYHAMAQTAYFQFQDQELEVQVVTGPLAVAAPEETDQLAAGMVLCRTQGGEIRVLIHDGQSGKRLLEACNRYCTRWVRLDI